MAKSKKRIKISYEFNAEFYSDEDFKQLLEDIKHPEYSYPVSGTCSLAHYSYHLIKGTGRVEVIETSDNIKER